MISLGTTWLLITGLDGTIHVGWSKGELPPMYWGHVLAGSCSWDMCTGTQLSLPHSVLLTGRLHLAAEPPTFCIEVFQQEKKSLVFISSVTC